MTPDELEDIGEMVRYEIQRIVEPLANEIKELKKDNLRYKKEILDILNG